MNLKAVSLVEILGPEKTAASVQRERVTSKGVPNVRYNRGLQPGNFNGELFIRVTLRSIYNQSIINL